MLRESLPINNKILLYGTERMVSQCQLELPTFAKMGVIGFGCNMPDGHGHECYLYEANNF